MVTLPELEFQETVLFVDPTLISWPNVGGVTVMTGLMENGVVEVLTISLG